MVVFSIAAMNMRNWMLVLSATQNGKIRQNNPGDVDVEPTKKKVLAKVMQYFPIISHLKRFFRNKAMLSSYSTKKSVTRSDAETPCR